MKHITEPELAQATELMAETVHNHWMAKRQKEKGWHSPEECPDLLLKGFDQCERCYWNKPIMTPCCYSDHVPEEGEKCQGFKRLSCPNCHPCMLPYKDLPDSEKELDRLYPTVFLSILKDMGFLVVKP